MSVWIAVKIVLGRPMMDGEPLTEWRQVRLRYGSDVPESEPMSSLSTYTGPRGKPEELWLWRIDLPSVSAMISIARELVLIAAELLRYGEFRVDEADWAQRVEELKLHLGIDTTKYPSGFRSPLDKSPASNIPRPGEDTSTWAMPPSKIRRLITDDLTRDVARDLLLIAYTDEDRHRNQKWFDSHPSINRALDILGLSAEEATRILSRYDEIPEYTDAQIARDIVWGGQS